MKDVSELSRAGYTYVNGTPKPPPLSQPKFTLAELKAAVPPHCFERSMVRSFGYLAWNISACLGLFYGAFVVLELMQFPLVLKVFGYLIYWFMQGGYMAGLWVLGHECGHQSFSENSVVNDIVGIFLQSALFTPYHSWKFSHRRHHLNVSSCENDELYVPPTKSDLKSSWSETLEDSPIYNLYKLVEMLAVGFQAYFCLNILGPKKYRNGPNSHFNPNSTLFTENERLGVIMSNIELICAASILGYFIYYYGIFLVFKFYLAPYIVLNGYLIVITYLHHTDLFVPHMREGEWSWLRGSLCTVDRTFGRFLDGVLHNISSTHVCHHLFSKMPHYHCIEATEALKPILGDYYLKDSTPIFIALWRAFTHCKFVSDNGPVVFYQKRM